MAMTMPAMVKEMRKGLFTFVSPDQV